MVHDSFRGSALEESARMGRVAVVLLPEGGGEEEREREEKREGWKEERTGRGKAEKLCCWTPLPHTFFST